MKLGKGGSDANKHLPCSCTLLQLPALTALRKVSQHMGPKLELVAGETQARTLLLTWPEWPEEALSHPRLPVSWPLSDTHLDFGINKLRPIFS